jgi:hemerythrin-like metal-binding protein
LKNLEWNKAYEVGNEDIDIQHIYFYRLIKRLQLASLNKKNPRYLELLIEELEKYAIFHFASEINIAIENHLSDVDAHAKLHEALLKKLKSYKSDVLRGEMKVEDFLQFVLKWFMSHTCYEDGRFFGSVKINSTKIKKEQIHD